MSTHRPSHGVSPSDRETRASHVPNRSLSALVTRLLDRERDALRRSIELAERAVRLGT